MEIAENVSAMEALRGRIKKHFSRFDGWVFGSAFLMTLLVHFYMFTNKLINHDDVDGLFSDCAFGLSSGRFSLQLVSKLSGAFSSPWVNGVLGAVFLAASVWLVVRILEIRHILPALLIGGIMVSFPTVASTYTYMFCSYQYLFAMFCASLGVFLIRKEKPLFLAAGIVVIAFGMGCYQAYFGFSAALLVLCLMLDVCRDRFSKKALPCFRTAVIYVLCLAAAMILYYGVLKLCLAVTGEELVSYQGISEMGNVTVPVLLGRIRDAYQNFVSHYSLGEAHRYPFAFSCLAVFSLLCWIGFVVASVIRRKLYRSAGTMLLLLLMLLVFPLSCNLVYVMTDSAFVHMVMVYPLVLPLLFPVIAAERAEFTENGSGFRRGLVLVLACVFLAGSAATAYEGILSTNYAYFCMDLSYENARAFLTRLTAKIEMQKGYVKGMPIAMYGYAVMDNNIPAVNITGAVSGNNILNMYSRYKFLAYYFASDYSFTDAETRNRIRESDAYAAMPCYPADGSIMVIDGVIVVKFSEE